MTTGKHEQTTSRQSKAISRQPEQVSDSHTIANFFKPLAQNVVAMHGPKFKLQEDIFHILSRLVCYVVRV